MTTKENRKNTNKRKNRFSGLLSLTLQFVPLYAFWLVLSQHYQFFYLFSGAIICGLIVLFNHEMFSSLLPTERKGSITISSSLRTAFHLIKYIPWLLIQIAKDNLLVAYLVIHPKMPVDPRLLGFKTGYRRSVSHVILANSITLSPGTMTILLENNRYLIHSLVPSACGNLLSGDTQERVSKIFDEEPEKPPETVSGYTFEEVE